MYSSAVYIGQFFKTQAEFPVENYSIDTGKENLTQLNMIIKKRDLKVCPNTGSKEKNHVARADDGTPILPRRTEKY